MAPKTNPESPKRDPKTTKMQPKSVQEGQDGPEIAQKRVGNRIWWKKGGLRDEKLIVLGGKMVEKSTKQRMKHRRDFRGRFWHCFFDFESKT